MRKSIAIVLTVLLVGMLVAPAAAASPEYTLKINDVPYAGVMSVENGTTMIPLEFIEKTLTAETTVENEQIKIVKDNDIMLLTLNSTEADFNGVKKAMPLAPLKGNNELMVPLRFVLESFGVQVNWDAAKYEISVAPTAVSLTAAEKLLEEISEAMVVSNTYKMKADTSMKMDMTTDGKTEHMTMSGTVDASMQQVPMLAYLTTAMQIDEITGTEEEIPADLLKSEMVMNDEGFFMTMPGQEGWVKLEMEGLDLNKLMEQSGSQDPVKSVMQMREFGAEVTIVDDQIIDGQAYGVIHITMGQEALGKYLNDALGQVGGMFSMDIQGAEAAELDVMMKELFKNFKADISYDIVFDKENFLPTTMTLDMAIDMNMDIPANEELGTPAQAMQMKMIQKAAYQMYDYGVAITVPKIEEFKTMNDLMEELVPTEPVPAEEAPVPDEQVPAEELPVDEVPADEEPTDETTEEVPAN